MTRRCGPPEAAALAVLVALSSASPLLAQEVVAARTLRAGTVLGEADLRSPGEGAVAADMVSELVGLETRRAIYAGRPVVPADLGPATLVRRNETVVMVYAEGGLGIRTEGRALESGGAGEFVRVMNLASRQAVLGVVTGANRVEVGR